MISVSAQPRKGTVRKDGAGRKWRKVRMLTTLDWEQAVLAGIAAARTSAICGSEGVTDGHLCAMGYDLVSPATPNPTPASTKE